MFDNNSVENNYLNDTNGDLFSFSLDNPYLINSDKQINNHFQTTELSTLNNSLSELERLSSSLVSFSEITKDVSGIDKKQNNIVFNTNKDNVPVQSESNYINNSSSKPVQQHISFIANPFNQTLSNSNENTFDYVVKSESFSDIYKKRMSKGKKITLISFSSVVLLFLVLFFVFWMLEFFGVTDFVWWKWLDPL